jgi:antitoxin MazE
MYSTIQKWGNSQGIRIPKLLLSIASMKEGDDIEIIAEYDKIIIKPRQKNVKKYKIEELLGDYNAKDKPGEVDWGLPAGKEEW